MTSFRENAGYFALLVGMTLGAASPTYAVDGVIEINQARALAGGVTATDTAGYPITIDASGSYRLTGDLVVPDENTTAVRVESSADDVALDLNGFSIFGPQLSGGGLGIVGASGGRVQIFNGSVVGVGNTAIFIASGTQAHVDSVVVRKNGGNGMSCTSADCFLSRSVFQQNAGSGIDCSFGICQVIDNRFRLMGSAGISITLGLVSRNIVNYSGTDGIKVNSAVVSENHVSNSGGSGILSLEDSVVTNNVVRNGTGVGLSLDATTGYSQNVVDSNGGTVVGGVQMGTNVCDGNTTCP
jgi:hypothetical protein